MAILKGMVVLKHLAIFNKLCYRNTQPINIPANDVGKCSFTIPLPISEYCLLKILSGAIFNVKMEFQLQIFHVYVCMKPALRGRDQQ